MAANILGDNHVTGDIKADLDSDLLKLAERWSQIVLDMDDMDRLNDNNIKMWDEFESLSKYLIGWMSEVNMKLANIDLQVKQSNVDTLKVCFKDVMVSFLFSLLVYFMFVGLPLFFFSKA